MAGRHYTALGYCDETDIENFLLTEIDNSFSAQIEDWIATAEKQINQYLGYTTVSGIFAEQITNEVTKGYVTPDLDLKVFPRKTPIISVEQLQLAKGTTRLTVTLTDSAGVAKYQIPTPGNYIAYPQYEFTVTGGSIINNLATLRGSEFYIYLNYTAGYTTVPADIRLATVNIVSDVIMRQANKEGLESITQGRVTKRWRQRDDGKSDFVKDAYELLRPYKIASQWL